MRRECSGKWQLWFSPSPFSPSSLFHPSSLLSLLAEIGWVLLTAFPLCRKGNLASRGSYAKNRSLDNCLSENLNAPSLTPTTGSWLWLVPKLGRAAAWRCHCSGPRAAPPHWRFSGVTECPAKLCFRIPGLLLHRSKVQKIAVSVKPLSLPSFGISTRLKTVLATKERAEMGSLRREGCNWGWR